MALRRVLPGSPPASQTANPRRPLDFMYSPLTANAVPTFLCFLSGNFVVRFFGQMRCDLPQQPCRGTSSNAVSQSCITPTTDDICTKSSPIHLTNTSREHYRKFKRECQRTRCQRDMFYVRPPVNRSILRPVSSTVIATFPSLCELIYDGSWNSPHIISPFDATVGCQVAMTNKVHPFLLHRDP